MWIPATAIPPSPTAAAQRLTEPDRTSPAAKIPGRLVSSGAGCRLFARHAGASTTSLPVFDKSFLVPLDFRRQPLCAWTSADHRENGRGLTTRRSPVRCFPIRLAPAFCRRTSLRISVRRESRCFRLRLHATRKVVRHLVGNVISPNDKQYFGGAVGKEHRGLAG